MNIPRRGFLQSFAGLGVAATFGTFLQRVAVGDHSYAASGYGGLRPVAHWC